MQLKEIEVTSVHRLIESLVGLCRLEKSPQDLPESTIMVVGSAILYLVCRVMLALFTMPFHYALLTGLVDTGSLVLFFGGVLKFYRVPHRTVQTLTAAFLVGLIVSAFLVIGFGAMSFAPVSAIRLGGGHLFAAPLVVWNLAINAHILREAVSIGFGKAVAIAILYYLVVWQVTEAVLPFEPVMQRG